MLKANNKNKKINTAQRKISIKDFFRKCDKILTFTKEILDGKPHFLCKVMYCLLFKINIETPKNMKQKHCGRL